MKNVYFVQVDVSSDADSKVLYLPYAVGLIAASAWKDETVKREYSFKGFIYRRDDVDKAVARLESPYLIGFSNYCWNAEYNRLFARKVKELYPDCIIVFGGHDIPDDPDFLREFPFVDILMHGEGEYNFRALMRELVSGDISSVNDITYKDSEGSFIRTEKTAVPHELDDFPSPYLEGWYDDIIKENPDIIFNAILETSRGCPNQCAYCDWGLLRSKTRLFSLERVLEEVRWMSRNKIAFIWGADANFGILERDVDIARYVVEQNKKYGYPEVFKPCYAKDSDDTVFEAGYILNSNHIDKGVTLAYQTLDSQTLENIGRRNLTLEHFSDLYSRYSEAGIPTYTELILGLPGETYESFCKGICDLLEFGQSNSMTVYECQVYDNSPMGEPEYREKYGIEVSRIPSFGIHYNPDYSGVQEYMDIITGTKTMPKEDWVKAYMFSVVLQTFHHLGVTRYFAVYLNKEKSVPYFVFYSMLFDYIYNECRGGYIHSLFLDLYKRKLDVETADWTYQKDVFGTTGWYFEEGAFLELAYHFEVFKEEIKPFLKKFDIEDKLFEELYKYQTSLVRLIDTQEVCVRSEYNFYPYFKAIEEGEKAELKQVKNVLRIRAQKTVSSWADYAREFVWFGKRYSATLMVNPRDEITYLETE